MRGYKNMVDICATEVSIMPIFTEAGTKVKDHTSVGPTPTEMVRSIFEPSTLINDV